MKQLPYFNKLDEDCSFNYYSKIFFIYLLSHGGIFIIPNAIFWDDWCIFFVSKECILDIFLKAGSMFNLTGYVHSILTPIGPWVYKYLTFVLMFATGFTLDKILIRNNKLNKSERFLVVIFFLILPFNSARVTAICFPYTLCYLLFFLGWLLFDKKRILSLSLFFLCFNTNSLLVFYIIPFIESFFRSSNWKFNIKIFTLFCLKKFDFFFIPFFYYGIKLFYFKPDEPYLHYNEINNIEGLIKAPAKFFIEIMKISTPIFFTILLSIIFLRSLRFIELYPQTFSRKNVFTISIIGFLFLYIGILPYAVVGCYPSFFEWTSRHQLLLPLGFSVVILSIWIRLGVQFRNIFISIVLSVSVLYNIMTYKDYYYDWRKQSMIVKLIKNNEIIKNSNLIVFNDLSLPFNIWNRIYRFYEWNGLLKLAFNDEKRLGINKNELIKFKNGNLLNSKYYSHYNASDFNSSNTHLKAVNVTINPEVSYTRYLLSKEPFSITVQNANYTNQ
jgi:hypothetical protein